MDTETLLRHIDAYLKRTGLKESTLSRRALNDGKAIARIRSGSRMWPETIQRMMDYMLASDGKESKVRRRA